MLDWSAHPSDPGNASRIVVNVPSRAALLAEAEARIAAGRGFCVATLNLDHVVKLRSDPAFRRAYHRMSHVTADGNPIVWLSRLAGQPLELAPGSDLVEPMAAMAARQGVPVAFFGSTDETLARAEAALVRRHPGLIVAVRISPSMGFDPEGPEAASAVEAVGASGAKLCFLALGAPKQEIFAAFAHERLSDVGILSFGAGLDFIAGAQTRAPALMRAVDAEWIWRLCREPRRLARRYALCIAIMPRLAWEALTVRRRGA